MICGRNANISLRTLWWSTNSQRTSGLICRIGVLLIRIWLDMSSRYSSSCEHSLVGLNAEDDLISCSLSIRCRAYEVRVHSLRISATGDTLREVPMTTRRSAFSRSTSSACSNWSSNFSPKNVMSGYGVSGVRVRKWFTKVNKTFIIPGGYSGVSLSSSASLSHCPLACFRVCLRFLGWALDGLHTGHKGTLRAMISGSISVPGTLRRHWRHVAVAKDPWHCKTCCTPARVSRVSIFWV